MLRLRVIVVRSARRSAVLPSLALCVLLCGAATLVAASPDDDALGGELLGAARDGDASRIEALLAAGAPLECRDAEGDTPLLRAALCAGADSLDVLLRAGADPAATSKENATALHRAAGDLAKVRLLIEKGADVNARSRAGNTPLILAARYAGAAPVLELLLAAGARVDARNESDVNALLTATASGDARSVRLLLEKGAIPVAPTSRFDEILGGWRTPLMWSAFRDDVDSLSLLLERGADPNEGFLLGTPLSAAAQAGRAAAARALIEHGANVNARERFSDYTALHWAASDERGETGLVELLLASGAEVDAPGGASVDAYLGQPITPLELALRRGRTPVVEALERAGARRTNERADERAGEASSGAVAEADAQPALPFTRASVRGAIAAAIPPLQRTARESKEFFLKQQQKQDCTSCHQQYLPFAAVARASDHGVPLDEKDTKKLRQMLEADHRNFLASDLEPTLHPEPAISLGLLLLAYAEAHEPASVLTDAAVHHLLAIQGKDGRWFLNLPRPPIQGSDVGATALALHAVLAYALPGRRDEIRARVERAAGWLASVDARTNEERVYQLLGLAWAGREPDALAELTAALLAEQRDDGGWAQLPGLASDAYATATTLYTLREAVAMPATHSALARGYRYLLATADAEGTWRARRRAFPFQPTMSSGFPHGRDAWLSAAATSWSVLAFASALDDPGLEEGAASASGVTTASGGTGGPSPAVAANPAGPAAGSSDVAVEFDRELRPLLERSCAPCHSGSKPRGGFSVETAERLAGGGNTGEPAVRAGDPDHSPLIRYVSDAEEDMEMPPLARRDRYPGLSASEIALFRRWIERAPGDGRDR